MNKLMHDSFFYTVLEMAERNDGNGIWKIDSIEIVVLSLISLISMKLKEDTGDDIYRG